VTSINRSRIPGHLAASNALQGLALDGLITGFTVETGGGWTVQPLGGERRTFAAEPAQVLAFAAQTVIEASPSGCCGSALGAAHCLDLTTPDDDRA
jgi:hypothetical protein